MYVAAGLAGVLHVVFFFMESVWWMKPWVQRAFTVDDQQARTMKLMAFNQGFYNLFLAGGAFVGIGLAADGRTAEGVALTTFACASMLGAAVVLAGSRRRMAAGAILQGIFPLVYMVLLAARLAS